MDLFPVRPEVNRGGTPETGLHYARNLKLDDKRFDSCLTNGRLPADAGSASSRGCWRGTGTPGILHQRSRSIWLTAVKRALSAQLTKSQKKVDRAAAFQALFSAAGLARAGSIFARLSLARAATTCSETLSFCQRCRVPLREAMNHALGRVCGRAPPPRNSGDSPRGGTDVAPHVQALVEYYL